MNLSHGIVCLLKPPGMTSHDAVAHVRRVLQTKRVGHTGTLDPAAAGVLPICVGLATRLVEALQSGTKEYLAEATFGYETDTLDAVGQNVREQEMGALDLSQLEAVCAQFRGEIQQQPPLHSALKIGGQKLYDIARAGGEVDIPLRPVTISALQVTRFFPAEHLHGRPHGRPRAFLRIECSGGTYVRSLVRDIGRALGGAATMTFLSRTRNGQFALAHTVTPQEFEARPEFMPLTEVLRSLYGVAQVDEVAVDALAQGRIITAPTVTQPAMSAPMVWSNAAGTLLALARHEGHGQWKPVRVFDLRV